MKIEVKGNKLIIEVDVSPKAIKEAPLSSSGKNKVVASTRGFQPAGDFRVSLNVITK